MEYQFLFGRCDDYQRELQKGDVIFHRDGTPVLCVSDPFESVKENAPNLIEIIYFGEEHPRYMGANIIPTVSNDMFIVRHPNEYAKRPHNCPNKDRSIFSVTPQHIELGDTVYIFSVGNQALKVLTITELENDMRHLKVQNEANEVLYMMVHSHEISKTPWFDDEYNITASIASNSNHQGENEKQVVRKWSEDIDVITFSSLQSNEIHTLEIAVTDIERKLFKRLDYHVQLSREYFILNAKVFNRFVEDFKTNGINFEHNTYEYTVADNTHIRKEYDAFFAKYLVDKSTISGLQVLPYWDLKSDDFWNVACPTIQYYLDCCDLKVVTPMVVREILKNISMIFSSVYGFPNKMYFYAFMGLYLLDRPDIKRVIETELFRTVVPKIHVGFSSWCDHMTSFLTNIFPLCGDDQDAIIRILDNSTAEWPFGNYFYNYLRKFKSDNVLIAYLNHIDRSNDDQYDHNSDALYHFEHLQNSILLKDVVYHKNIDIVLKFINIFAIGNKYRNYRENDSMQRLFALLARYLGGKNERIQLEVLKYDVINYDSIIRDKWEKFPERVKLFYLRTVKNAPIFLLEKILMDPYEQVLQLGFERICSAEPKYAIYFQHIPFISGKMYEKSVKYLDKWREEQNRWENYDYEEDWEQHNELNQMLPFKPSKWEVNAEITITPNHEQIANWLAIMQRKGYKSREFAKMLFEQSEIKKYYPLPLHWYDNNRIRFEYGVRFVNYIRTLRKTIEELAQSYPNVYFMYTCRHLSKMMLKYLDRYEKEVQLDGRISNRLRGARRRRER